MQESSYSTAVIVSHACSYKCLPQFIEVLNSAGFLLLLWDTCSCHELVLARSISCQSTIYFDEKFNGVEYN